jgi:hypothetical protein
MARILYLPPCRHAASPQHTAFPPASGDILHSMARRPWLLSLLIGASFVGILELLGHHDLATPVPFWLLLPGLFAGAIIPGSGFDLKDDHPWSLPSTLVVYAVNVAIYGGLANLLLNRSGFLKVSLRDR